uniref:E3 ubiquitin-protein ligase RNF13 n=1 Tax=Lygus hesperus TaxID=30085 RepID=A0A0A9Z5W7_LYGHE
MFAMAKSWKVLALLNIAIVAADLEIFPESDPMIIVADFLDAEANFGFDIPKNGLSTMVVLAEPENGCSKLSPPPPNISGPNPAYWAVLIKRYNCSFEDKVYNAQEAFYDVAIIHNVDSNKLEIMNASNPERIHISAVFISGNAGKEIKSKYLYDKGYIVRIEPNSSSDLLGKILIPFVVIISTSFTIMIGIMIMKCIKDHRRARRRRLPNSSLNKIPTAKFRKNDPFETCAICLDDFIEGEKLRILPCSHAYHCKCIDPWLTRNRRVCPMCKRKVFAADEPPQSDDSSSEDDDHTPLLRGRGPTTYGGTRGWTPLSGNDLEEFLEQNRDEFNRIQTLIHNRPGGPLIIADLEASIGTAGGSEEQNNCHHTSASNSESFSSASSGVDSDDVYNPFNPSTSHQNPVNGSASSQSQSVASESITVQVVPSLFGSSPQSTSDKSTRPADC